MNNSMSTLCEKNMQSWSASQEHQCDELRTNVCEDNYCHCTLSKDQLCYVNYVNSDIGGENNDNI